MIGLFGALGIISDIVSLSQGEIPLGSVIKMMPSPFAKKKRGMSVAQAKKKMMMHKRRQMRNLVDTVIAPKEKKMQRDRLEERIEEEKAKIDKKKKEALTVSEKRLSQSRSPSKKSGAISNSGVSKYRKKYGNYGENEEEDEENKHLSMIQHVLIQEKANQGDSFVDKIKKSRDQDGSSNKNSR
ncbi:MAG: hypothetical protein ACJAS6_000523 [Rickettsiales bacterium]|jgi:hypothetical protein